MKAGLRAAVACAACLSLAGAACRSSQSAESPAKIASPDRATLAAVTLPDLSRMDPPVQAQARERYAVLEQRRAAPGTSDADLAVAYGEYAVLLHAAEYDEAALPAYLNAQALQPGDMRWPYYLGHLYKSEGDTGQALQAFTRALQIRPDDLATLVWLGRMYLEQGEPDRAEPLFAKAAAATPRTVAAVAGLGQTALARRDYARAVTLLEDAITLDPRAASIHSPLAMAYRGLGDQARAESHLKQWRNTELPVVDPLSDALATSVQSGLSYELQGVSALDRRDFAAAAALFRKGVDVTPGTNSLGRSLRHKLGTALALSGDIPSAVALFEEVTRLAPPGILDEPAGKAHYSLGVIMAGGGQRPRAIRHLTDAVSYSPNYLEARQALADALRSAGRFDDALVQYREAVRINPNAGDARFGYALALVKLRRYVEARDWLTESVRVQPDRPELAHALARLLATAPDARARDGQRAATVVKELLAQHQNTELGETLAMTLAELGQFGEAVSVQQGVIQAATRGGLTRALRHMHANLLRYQQGQACRVPWPDDDPVHSPGPQGDI